MRQRLTLGQIETARANLDSLPAPDDSDIPVDLQDAIRKLAPTIRKLLARGYSRQQVVDFLAQSGIQISAGTLKDYLGGGKRKQLRGTQLGDDLSADTAPPPEAAQARVTATPASGKESAPVTPAPSSSRPAVDGGGAPSASRRHASPAG